MSRYLPPLLLVALLGVTTLIGWRSSAEGEADLIKIVSSLPRTGSAKAQTDTIVNGIRIALEEAGWTGRRVQDRVRRLGRRHGRRRPVDGRGRNGQRRPRGPRSGRDGLHRHLQLRRRQDLDADPQQGPPADDQPGQHLARPDQARQGRSGRAGHLSPHRQRSTTSASCRPTTCKARWAPPGPRRWASSGSTCSTTTRSTARASPRCSSRPARTWASKCWGTRASTTRPRNSSR